MKLLTGWNPENTDLQNKKWLNLAIFYGGEGGICQCAEGIFVGWHEVTGSRLPQKRVHSNKIADRLKTWKYRLTKQKMAKLAIFMAEKEGFEPSLQFPALHP